MLKCLMYAIHLVIISTAKEASDKIMHDNLVTMATCACYGVITSYV